MQPTDSHMLVKCFAGIKRVGHVQNEIVERIKRNAPNQPSDRGPRIHIPEQQPGNEGRQDRHRRQAVELLQQVDDAFCIFIDGNEQDRRDRQDDRHNRREPPVVGNWTDKFVVKIDRV